MTQNIPGLLISVGLFEDNVELEWDPGCSCCLLNERVWRVIKTKNRLSLDSAPEVFMADGNRLNVIGRVKCDITLPNGVTYKWPFVIVKNILIDGFVGSDLMKEVGALTDHLTDTVYFRPSDFSQNLISLEQCVKTRLRDVTRPCDSVQAISVRLSKDVCVRAGCKRIVCVEIDESVNPGSALVVVEPDQEYFKTRNSTALAAAQSDNPNNMLLAVANLSDQPVTLKKGEVVGKVQCVDEVSPVSPLNLEQNTNRTNARCSVKTISTSDSMILPIGFKVDLPDLPHDQTKLVKSLLAEFKDIFSSGEFDVGCTKLVQHNIEISSSKPILERPRRLAVHVQVKIQEMINDMLKCGIIQPSQSPWCAPVVVVTKKNGSKRLCVDFRKLNAVTIRDSYPLPRIDDVLSVLSGCRYFSVLDMKSGYHQIEVAPEDRSKTAFSIGTGLYEWVRMPFGLVNAPATFSRLMTTLLAGLSFEEVVSYLDDILVYSRSFLDHLAALRRVFERFRAANLKLSPEKCKWFRQETEFLGFLVTEKGVATHPEKIEKVKNVPIPSSPKDVRAFLGLASYYRRHVKDFAKIAFPLTQLLCKDVIKRKQFVWSIECESAFQLLKSKLVSAPILALPRFGEPFRLCTDASNFAVGCVLEQVQDGKTRVIAYASQVLTPNKRKWSAFQREAYALLWASRKFRHYILGGKVTFITDHAPLTHLRKKESIPEKVQTYFAELEQYDYSLIHRPGKKHGNADALSRMPQPLSDDQSSTKSTNEGCCSIKLPSISDTEWNDTQNEDVNIRVVKEWIQQGKPARSAAAESEELKHFWNSFNQLTVNKSNGILYKSAKDGSLKLVVPLHKREEMLLLHHDLPTSGHRGVAQTYEKLQQNLWWPGMKEDTSYWCNSCEACAHFKTVSNVKAPMGSLTAGNPYEVVALDFVGPMATPTKSGNLYLLVMVDYFTRYVEAVPLPDRRASTVAHAIMQEWISRHGVMETIHTDQAQEFESELMEELCTLLHIKKTRSSPFHPEGNGICERLNGTLLSILKLCMYENVCDWDSLVPNVLLAYRATKHSSTGFTPAYLHNGRELRLPPQVIFPAPDKEPQMTTAYARNLRKNLKNAFYAVSQNLKRTHEITKDRSQHYPRYRPYEIGDLVYVLTPKGSLGKLGEVWCGPWKIIGKTGVLYTVEWVSDGSKRKRIRKYHYNLLKFCCPRQPDRWTLQPQNKCDIDIACENDVTVNRERPKRVIKPPSRFGDWDYSNTIPNHDDNNSFI